MSTNMGMRAGGATLDRLRDRRSPRRAVRSSRSAWPWGSVMLAWLLLVPIGWALTGPTDLPVGLTDALASALGWLGDLLPWTWAQGVASVSPADVEAVLGPAVAPATELSLAALAVGGFIGLTELWAPKHAETMCHEIGHALVGAALGARIMSLVTFREGGGEVLSQFHRERPVATALVSLAGYPFPGLLALAGGRLALSGLAGTWLVYLVALLTVTLVVVTRSWWAALVAVTLGAAAVVTLVLGSTVVVAAAVLALAGMLSVRGCHSAHWQWHLSRTGGYCDATILANGRRAWPTVIAGAQVLVAWALAAALPWLLLSQYL